MMKGFGDIMQQAQKMQADMQERMEKMQKELADLRVTGEAGAGMVKVTMSGRHDVTSVNIDPSLERAGRPAGNRRGRCRYGEGHHERASRCNLGGH